MSRRDEIRRTIKNLRWRVEGGYVNDEVDALILTSLAILLEEIEAMQHDKKRGSK